jgi:TonB-dependent starch-binding outer membrane protein SusC
VNVWEGISINAKYSIDTSSSVHRFASSRALKPFYKGEFFENSLEKIHQNGEIFIDYEENIDDFRLKITSGANLQEIVRRQKSKKFADYATDDVAEILDFPAAAASILGMGSAVAGEQYSAYFLKANLNYKEKGTLSFTVRRDDTNKLDFDSKAYFYPAAMGRWNFISPADNKNISTLSLRASYGISANLFALKRTIFGQADTIGKVFQPNLGLELGLFHNRIYINIDAFQKTTDRIYQEVFLSQPANVLSIATYTKGMMKTQGIELDLKVLAMQRKHFTWQMSANLLWNRMVLQKSNNSIIRQGNIYGQGLTGAYVQSTLEGQPPYAFYLRKFSDYDTDGNSIYADGDFQQFLNGQNPFPSIVAGVANTFKYKNLDFSFLLHGVAGNYIYNNTTNGHFTKGVMLSGRNVTKEVLTLKEGIFNTPDVSTRFLEKGDFVKLSNLSIGYTWQPAFAKKASVKFFMAGQNLLTFTKYSGQDPEFISHNNNYGVDYLRFPSEKSLTFGINLLY